MKKIKEISPEQLKQEREIEDIITDCILKGKLYRDQFKFQWDEITQQVEQVPPQSWSQKEPWQTKIYMPLQATGSETCFAKFKKILFSQSKIVDVIGIDKEHKKGLGYLLDLFGMLMGTEFEQENDSVLQQAGDWGSSFLKVLAKPDYKDRSKDKLSFTCRSPYNCMVDPKCGNNFSKASWWIDEIEDKDISELIEDARKPEKDRLYNKEAIDRMVKDASNKSETQEKSYAKTDLATIKSIDGVSDIQIPSAWKKILMYEWWGLMKVPVKKEETKTKKTLEQVVEYTTEWRVITMADMGGKKYILRNDINEYGRIPVVMLPLKMRMFEVYGKGFLKNGIGLQELACSMINLGFDSEKIRSFFITILDVNKVSDWNTVKFAPMAKWHMTDVNGAKLGANAGQSSLVEIVTRGLPFIDQLYQDATNLTRHAQGTAPLGGGSGSETLGEYELKMQSVDDKFLAQAKVVESRYAKPLFSLIYSIITNSKLFSQKACDRLLGTDTITIQQPIIDKATGMPIIDPNTGQPQVQSVEQEESKLKLADLERDVELDYRLIGVTQLQQIIQMKEQITQIMTIVSKMPQFMQYIKPEGLLKSFVNAMRVPDSDEILKSDEEINQDKDAIISQLQATIQQLTQGMKQQGGGQMPQPEGAM